MDKKEVTMVYPEEFKAQVLKVYPNIPRLATLLETGNCISVYQFLKAATPCWGQIMLKAASFEEFQELAKKELEHLWLFQAWNYLYLEQHPDLLDILTNI